MLIWLIWLKLKCFVRASAWAGTCACLSGLVKPRCVSAANKRLLDGGFGAKSWLGILINHWPSCWILTSLYSFICCCCSLSCPPACSSPVYAYPVDIPPLLSPLWMALLPLPLSLPSSLPLSHLFLCICVTFSLSSPPLFFIPSDSPPVGLVFSRPGQASSLPNTLFSSSARLIDSAGAKKGEIYTS